MTKCLVIDDEPLSREVIQRFIENTGDIEVLGSFSNAFEALKFLKSNSVDLLFLDINMPELSGVDFIKQLPHPPSVIFITAYPDYAVEGFELNAIDYLVKPVSFERFTRALQKYTRGQTDIQRMSANLIVKVDKRTYSLDMRDIFHLQSAGDYIKIFGKEQNLVIHDTMKEMLLKLTSNFIRIHKSYIVNMDHLSYVEGNRIKIGNQLLPIGAKYRVEVLDKIKK